MRFILYLLSKILHRIINCDLDFFRTLFFRYVLWINNVEVGKKIRVKHAIPPFWKQNGGCGKIIIGDNVTFVSYGDQSYNSRCKIMVEKDAHLCIGNNTGFNGVLIYCQESVTIGNYVKVGGGTRIFDTDHHPIDWKKRRQTNNDMLAKHSPIVIKDDVFIGTGCFIMKGVTIGERSIIAAGSIVVKDVPADCIAGGNPCKVIKKIG